MLTKFFSVFNLEHLGPKMGAGFVYSLGGGILLGVVYMFLSFGLILLDWAFNFIGNWFYLLLSIVGFFLLCYFIGSYLFYKWEPK